MNIEFHYYITYLIAINAGFSREAAYIIAYSSQFVDDNHKQIDVVNHSMRTTYRSTPTQIEMLSTGKKRDQILQTHHFLPGDRVGFSLITTPNSQLANIVLENALNSNNLYSIGIASHAYVDTWAHQNFSGCQAKINGMPGWGKAFIPNIGHADALDDPDSLDAWWHDHRAPHKGIIKNSDRFLESAFHLYYHYYKYLHPRGLPDCRGFLSELARVFKAYRARYRFSRISMMQRRKRRYSRMAVNISGAPIPRYQEGLWLDQALQAVENGSFVSGKYTVRRGVDLAASHWWQFQEAAKGFQQKISSIIVRRSNNLDASKNI